MSKKPSKKRKTLREKAASDTLGETWPTELPSKRIKYCNCGNYRPRSTDGLINTSCANCGGAYCPTTYK